MYFTRILDFLKLNIKSYIIIFLCTFIITLLPDSVLSSLGLLSAYTSFKIYISLALIVSGISVIVLLIEVLFKKHRPYSLIKKKKQIMIERLIKMTDTEKKLCRKAINNDGVILLEINNGIGSSLIDHKIIIRCSGMSFEYKFFSYRLHDWAFEYLKANPQLIR